MAKKKSISLFVFLLVSSASSVAGASPLSYDFYKTSCPNAEKIIRTVAAQKQLEAPTTAAGALRIFFHDCFVDGCDASVLIASSESNKAERDAEINLSLPGDGFDVFFRAKRALELQCPGVVSCADVMAIATRDLVNLVGGPRWEVYKGRRDSLVSKASRVAGSLPLANHTVSELIGLFGAKGLTVQDTVALSGGHTIGFSHCKEFVSRIYAYNKTFDVDPAMDGGFARSLRSPCPDEGRGRRLDPAVVAFNDVTTPVVFDNAYFRNLQRGLGLLATDQSLYADPRTRGLVDAMAKDQSLFFGYFVAGMVKLGNLGVKTGGSGGEIRRDCGFFNG